MRRGARGRISPRPSQPGVLDPSLRESLIGRATRPHPKTGNVDQRTIDKFEREAKERNRESW